MSDNEFRQAGLAQVSLESQAELPVLIFVRDLPHPRQAVWEALTDPAQLREWAPFKAASSLAITGPVTLRMSDESQTEEFPCTVRRAVAPEVLEYDWGGDILTWELAATSTGTRLTLRHVTSGLDWVPKVAAGWHMCLVVMDQFLAGQPIGPIAGSEAKKHGWQELHDEYAATLGIEAP